jgi:dihydroorotase
MDKPVKAKKILLTGGEVLDPVTKKREKADIVIIDGKIDKIGKMEAGQFSGQQVDISGAVVVPGLVDMHVHLREPGREDEETIESGCNAAMAGGFTAVCPMPNTDPPCDKQEVVHFLKNTAANGLVNVYPIGAVTKNRAGTEITEMADMVRAGAVAFSDDGSPIFNTAVLRRALEYSSMFDVPIIDHCEDPYLFAGGHMNESRMSTLLGLSPIPNLCEDVMVARDILMAQYVNGHIHIAHISTKGSVELIRRAKAEGIRVTCEVTPHHLVFTDADLRTFNTNLKMNPPLRTKSDVEALHKGLQDGTIDAIASDHAPHSSEEKDVEFAAAPFGIIGLETSLGIVISKIVSTGVLSLEEALLKMSVIPRRILNLPVPLIKEKEIADMTILNPRQKWQVDPKKLKSLSRNTPYAGWELSGAAMAVFNKGLFWQS